MEPLLLNEREIARECTLLGYEELRNIAGAWCNSRYIKFPRGRTRLDSRTLLNETWDIRISLHFYQLACYNNFSIELKLGQIMFHAGLGMVIG